MSEPSDAETTTGYNDERHPPHRLLMLADGVFAISMTLLALDVRIPDTVADSNIAYGNAQWELYGRLGVFIAAFMITSRFWVLNHQQMRVLHHGDGGVIERTIQFLAGICSIPVATSVLFRFGSVPAAVTFAALVLAATGLLSGRLWWYVSDPARDLAEVEPDVRHRVMIRGLMVVVIYLLAIPVAYLLPASHSGYAPLVWLLLIGIDPVADRVAGRIWRSS